MKIAGRDGVTRRPKRDARGQGKFLKTGPKREVLFINIERLGTAGKRFFERRRPGFPELRRLEPLEEIS